MDEPPEETSPPMPPFASVDDAVDFIGFGKFQKRLMLLCGLGWAGK